MQTKNLIQRIFLTIIGIFLFQTSFCQENYLQGYIIPLNGDTLHGFIDYQNWGSNPVKIFFRNKKDDKKVSYTPTDIKKFGVLDEVFESAIVETEISSDNTLHLDINNVLKFKTDTVFLQTMIMGPKSLYYYNNKFGKKNFYIKQESVYELLIHKKYLKEQDGKTVIAENKRYLGQLSLYLKDCPTIQSKLKYTEYVKDNLEKLFQNYYNCSNSVIQFQKKTEKLHTELGVLAGMSLTTLKFNDNSDANLLISDYNQSVNFATGIFLNIILPRNQGRWSIYNELGYSAYKVTGHSENYTNETYYTNSYGTLGYSYLKMVNMLRYKYPIGNLFVFVNAGISNGFAISETNHLKQEVVFYGPQTINELKALDRTRLYEQGYVVGLGTKYKKYSFEFRFEKGNGMSDYNSLSSITTRYYFLLGYSF